MAPGQEGGAEPGPEEILRLAASLARAEIRAGELAARSADPAVQAVARDRAALGRELLGRLEARAQAQGLALPERPIPEHEAVLEGLTPLSGRELDRRYAEMAGQSQALAQRVYRAVPEDGDPGLAALADEALRLLETQAEPTRRLVEATRP
jgi:predicted outer membrane protein